MKGQDKFDKDELIKSLEDLSFSQEEIDSIVEKAEKEGKFAPPAGSKAPDDDDETIDEKAVKKLDGKEKEEMQKSCDKIVKMKDELDKSMSAFLDKYGSAPGIPTPTTDLEKVKSEKLDIEKSEVNSFEKAFGSKFETIEKGLEAQTKINEEFLKSLQGISATVNAIAEAPNPFKSILGNYKGSLLEKGEKVGEDGKRVISLKNKEYALNEFQKAVDKVENEDDKQIVRNMISDFTIANKVSEIGINIVKKALNIDIEK